MRSPACFAIGDQEVAAAREQVEEALTEALAKRDVAFAAARASAKLDACREPKLSTDCELARDYVDLLTRFQPRSSKAAEVQTLIEASRPRLAELADHEAWAKVDVTTCAAGKTEDACDAVDAYLVKRPSGLHAAEGKTALAKAKPKIQALVAKRKAEERAQEGRERAEAARQAALERSRSKPEFWPRVPPEVSLAAKWRQCRGRSHLHAIAGDRGVVPRLERQGMHRA